jgi:DHA2 family multidrug resistance protein
MVQMLTSTRPFINPMIFRDWNYCTGLVLLFFASAVPMSTMILMPLLMQNVLGYPVQTVGMLMAPRGLGSLIATWAAVRCCNTLGPRTTVVIGLGIIIMTLAMMANFTTDTGESILMMTGLFQGLGAGLVFTPMNFIMLATIDRRFLTEISSFSNLVRSIGGSVGISVFVTLLSQNSQVVRAGLTEFVSPFSHSLDQLAGRATGSNPQVALAMMNGEIDLQATMTAYVDDFKLLMIMTCVLVPLIFVFRGYRRDAVIEQQTAIVEV